MTLDVTRLELSPFGRNCYLVRRPDGDEAIVVDPGWPGDLFTALLTAGAFAAFLAK